MVTEQELIEKIRDYDPNADFDLLRQAFEFGAKKHAHQIRASGEPYFTHPIQVAMILASMKLDMASIVTALLHDTIEDTDATPEEVRQLFGNEVAQLVDGVTKLTQIELQSHNTKQAENFRKLVLAMSNDIRVLLVKLADRLHNMRTLNHISSSVKRQQIATETLEIYAPLAHRIGMNTMKDELEDLAFMELNLEARESILSRLSFLRKENEDLVATILKSLEEVLQKNNLPAIIAGREKSPYSIWNKMLHKNVLFEQLTDIMAFRILVNTIPQVYQALGILHATYPVIPGRFKDYISTPKPNNYQSIHTAVFGPKGYRIEVQIRTSGMHEINEYGVAAHWKYKEHSKESDGQHFRWLRSLLDILENAPDPQEFLEHTKLEMYQDQVFCFTPGGDLITLPSGATPIDFAYAVHSEVGNHCVAAKINGRMVPLRTVLHNGDQVEITTSKAQTPSPTWERYAVTGKARASIRRFIRSQRRQQFLNLGREIFTKTIKHESVPPIESLTSAQQEATGYKTLEDLFISVGQGQKTIYETLRQLYPGHQLEPKQQGIIPSKRYKPAPPEDAVAISGLVAGMAVHYAGCCHPLPGDKIVGIVVTGRGVTIHTYDCHNLDKYTDEPDRWLDLAWNTISSHDSAFVSRLHVVVFNKVGSLGNLTSLIGKQSGNIVNLKIMNRSELFFEIIVDVEVKDTSQLNSMMASMRTSSYINSVERTSR